MSESKAQSASDISREAKGLNQILQEILKSRDPWERDLEFQRKNLRRQYLRLLLVHPYAKESKDSETRLWMQTSYAFISVYKQRITRADPSGSPKGPRHGRREAQGGGAVEYRKLLTRFRQYLSDEEKFWTQLIVRLCRYYGLVDELHSILVTLELVPQDDEGVSNQPQSDTGGRGQNMFPVEDGTIVASNLEQRQSQLSIVSKALVCLGDIARYREQYNEKGGRPKAGQEAGPPARINGKKQKGDSVPRSRDYERAHQRYEHARNLVPTEGNASHQMAILASYQRDTFGSLVHYYRALCVRQPYETAAENMDKALSKVLDNWKSHGESTTIKQLPRIPRLIDSLKERIVVLHAFWAHGEEQMDDGLLQDSVVKSLRELVSERILSIETISKIIILTEGVMWKHRMLRSSRNKSSSSAVEAQIATHLLAVHRALLEVGAEQLKEAPPDDSEDLAQNITATFRRTLPALRMASKWLRANFKFLENDGARALPIVGIRDFWASYARFSTALERMFPLESLPHLTTPLEEDLDTQGFLPLNELMVTRTTSNKSLNPEKHLSREQVHPNEEQLMRLWDLLTDAKVIAESHEAPIVFRFNEYAVKGSEPSHGGTETRRFLNAARSSDELEISHTDDDPVSEAFRAVVDVNGGQFEDEANGNDDDNDMEEGDQIVWDLSGQSLSPIPKFPEADIQLPTVSSTASSNPKVPKSLVPTHVQMASSVSSTLKPMGTTAQDLLDGVMGLSTSHSETAGVKSPLGSSIWSPFVDNSRYPVANNHHQRSRLQHTAPGSPFSFTPFSAERQNYQTHKMDVLPHPIGHQRTPSTNYSDVAHDWNGQSGFLGVNRQQATAIPNYNAFSDPPRGSSPNYSISGAQHVFTHTQPQQLWGNAG